MYHQFTKKKKKNIICVRVYIYHWYAKGLKMFFLIFFSKVKFSILSELSFTLYDAASIKINLNEYLI